MQIALCATVGDVPPKFILRDLPEACKPIEHADFKLSGVYSVVGFDERVAQVVDHEFLEALERAVIEVEIVRVSHVVFCAGFQLGFVVFNHLVDAGYKFLWKEG